MIGEKPVIWDQQRGKENENNLLQSSLALTK